MVIFPNFLNVQFLLQVFLNLSKHYTLIISIDIKVITFLYT